MEIIYAQKDDQGIIQCWTAEEAVAVKFRDVRCGLSWPEKSAPAYFCILGQRTEKNVYDKYPLVFLRGGESHNLQELFRALSDDMSMLCASEIHCDLRSDFEGFGDLFGRFTAERKVKGLHLVQAPYPENFRYGLSVVEDVVKKKALEISSETVLQQQLGRIPRGDLGEHPEVEYYAASALRYVVSAYEKYSGGHMTQEEADKLYEQYGPPSPRAA